MHKLEIPVEKMKAFHNQMNKAGVNYKVLESSDTVTTVVLDSKKELKAAKDILSILSTLMLFVPVN